MESKNQGLVQGFFLFKRVKFKFSFPGLYTPQKRMAPKNTPGPKRRGDRRQSIEMQLLPPFRC